MNLSSPLSSLIPSMDAVALEVLAGTQGALGASKIQQLGRRGSRQGIVNALDRLVRHGLVLSEPTNFGSMYRLNRQHLLAPAVLQAAEARHELLRRLEHECGELDPVPVSATLFGSVARNESTSDSDIDLLIVLDTHPQDLDAWVDRLHRLSDLVEMWTGNRLQVITHDIDHLRQLVRAGEPIVESWREDGITVFGADIRTLLGHEQPAAHR